MLHRLPGRLQHEAVLRVDRGRFALTDSEELGIETTDVIDESAPSRNRPAGHAGLGVIVLIDVPPVRGDLGDQIVAAQQRFPQQFGGVDAARQSAAHADYRDRCDTSFEHSTTFRTHHPAEPPPTARLDSPGGLCAGPDSVNPRFTRTIEDNEDLLRITKPGDGLLAERGYCGDHSS